MKPVLVIILLYISLALSAQKWEKSVNANYNWTFIAQSIEGSVNFRNGHHVLATGIQVYLNQYADFYEGSYKNVGYAENWYDRIGLNFSYQYNICKDTRVVNPYFFYQNQVSHLCFREPTYDSVIHWTEIGTISDPHWVMEQFIGIGFIFQIFNNIYVFQEAGLGAAFWNNNPDSMQNILWEWDYTLKVGLLYRFASSHLL
ncbi:MAG: hypothetical protein MUC31_01110 [Bacteroidales bacterium]|jgi:hypothetical protein|nr:hypothetical protein [Bacteroidales bacterium]